MGHADGTAVFAVEQDDDALVRLAPLGEVLRIDADQLGPEDRPLAERARHHAEGPPLAQRDDGAQQLARLAAGEGDHRPADQGDADLIGQARAHLVASDDAHQPPRPSSQATQARSCTAWPSDL